MKSKVKIGFVTRQELIDHLESMRLKEEPVKVTTVSSIEETQKDVDAIPFMNNPDFYGAQVPFLLCDKNGETVISRTAKGINERKLNPFELNWMEITLYSTDFVRQLLENIESTFIKDVAQAIEDEYIRHGREDGQYTNITSDNYGTGQGNPAFYSYVRNNWEDNEDYVSAVTIANGILDKRQKAEEYKKKMEAPKNGLIAQTIFGSAPTVPEYDSDIQELLGQIDDLKEEVNQLAREKEDLESSLKNEKEKAARELNERTKSMNEQYKKERREFWKKFNEQQHINEPEKAYNVQTDAPCLTSTQMGILMEAVGMLTEEHAPGKTTLGLVVENISGYKMKTVNQNMKGIHRDVDKEAVATAIETKFPKLAAKVRKL